MTDIVERLREWAKSIRRKPTPLIEAIPMVSCAADEIEILRRQLAEKDAEIERLKANSITRTGQLLDGIIAQAASQLREQQLREALIILRGQGSTLPFITTVTNKALTLPQDDTALRELVAKAGEVMRERCAIEATKAWHQSTCYIHDITDAIRALPGVTLEDLK